MASRKPLSRELHAAINNATTHPVHGQTLYDHFLKRRDMLEAKAKLAAVNALEDPGARAGALRLVGRWREVSELVETLDRFINEP